VLIDDIKECSKCGVCRAACPIFLIANNETASPRGRVSLVEAMLEGKLSISDRYIDTIRACIKCTRCADVCPSGVRPEKIVQSAREMLFDAVGAPEDIKEALRLTGRPKQFHEHLINKYVRGKSENDIPLWQLPLMFHENTYLPNLAEKSVLESYPEYINAYGKQKVALFVGCSVNYSYTGIADSVIDVLKKLGVSVFIPKDQLCCGAPLLFYGDIEGTKALAKINLDVLTYNDFDAVLTLCPACGITLKQDYERLLGASDWTSKIYDVSEYIAKFCDYNSQKTNMSVTYHDPCYLRLGQKISAEPRRILRDISQYIEMKNADKCCGLGGTLGLFHPEISQKIGESKVKSIINSGADIVATGCPGCMLFIKDMLKKNGINREVLHTIQVLQKTL
jgi:glycolate oxidase iron-sulfur subunit